MTVFFRGLPVDFGFQPSGVEDGFQQQLQLVLYFYWLKNDLDFDC